MVASLSPCASVGSHDLWSRGLIVMLRMPSLARLAASQGHSNVVKQLGKDRLAKMITSYDHIKALDSALHKAEGWGLEKYLPAKRLFPGEDLSAESLVPPDEDLTAANLV